MNQKLPSAQLGPLHEGDVMCWCDSLWTLKPWCRIEGFIRCIHLGWTTYDVADGLSVVHTAHY